MSLEEIRKVRLEKLKKVEERQGNAFPISTHKDFDLKSVSEKFEEIKDKEVYLVGRVMSIRAQGGLIFFNFYDGSGPFQGLLKRGDTVEEELQTFSELVDIGDFVEVKGALFITKRGEKTILVKSWRMLAKSLRSLPEKWAGLSDTEERYRHRYLDVLMSSEVKERFEMRSKIVSVVRNIFDNNGYIEVETPILQPIAGGASAKPFSTHHNALDVDLFLRIAPELYLKELLVAGFNKVYEIGRLFRNEGIDITHNPEFTTIEYYEAYLDADKYMQFTEKVIREIVQIVKGNLKIETKEESINFERAFPRISFMGILKDRCGVKDEHLNDIELAKELAKEKGVSVEKGDTPAKILDSLYKKFIRPTLIQPTFLTDYPLAFSPLAKRQEDNGDFIEHVQLVVGGFEIVKMFSELNNPIDQRDRFINQEKQKATGDEEAQPKDEDYIEAMEYGMPPAAGAAISIDRLTMILTGQKNIREVILFPTLRPKN